MLQYQFIQLAFAKRRKVKKTFGKWIYLLGLLIAVLAGLFSFTAVWLSLVLLVLAIFAGLFYFETDDLKKFSIYYMGFVLVKGAFGAIPAIGTYLDGIFTAVAMFLAPVLLTVFVYWFVKKYFTSEE